MSWQIFSLKQKNAKEEVPVVKTLKDYQGGKQVAGNRLFNCIDYFLRRIIGKIGLS
jgi:hypothetical protein